MRQSRCEPASRRWVQQWIQEAKRCCCCWRAKRTSGGSPAGVSGGWCDEPSERFAPCSGQLESMKTEEIVREYCVDRCWSGRRGSHHCVHHLLASTQSGSRSRGRELSMGGGTAAWAGARSATLTEGLVSRRTSPSRWQESVRNPIGGDAHSLAFR